MKFETPPAYEEEFPDSENDKRKHPYPASTTESQREVEDESDIDHHSDAFTAGTATPNEGSENSAFSDESASPNGTPRCSLLPSLSAVWSVTGETFELSALASMILLKSGILKSHELELLGYLKPEPSHPPSKADEPTDPISGILLAANKTIGGVLTGLADYPIEIARMAKQDGAGAKRMATEFALDKGRGVGRIVGTGLRAPMDYTLGISKGFHNLPKACGDTTVRDAENVTGIQSGLIAAGKGFGFGLYDGISGIFIQPIEGAKEKGALGFAAGLGKGILGAVCKPAAGAVGLPAYALKGIYEGFRTERPLDVEKHMHALGVEEWENTPSETREKIILKWYELHRL